MTKKPNQTKSCIFDMYKENVVSNNLQWLIYHKTQTNHIIDI